MLIKLTQARKGQIGKRLNNCVQQIT